ncbi:MAG: right-handed parallel beta-helix repeat-containing protein [Bacteroidota bacterium]
MLITRTISEKKPFGRLLKYTLLLAAAIGLFYYLLLPWYWIQQSLSDPQLILCDAELSKRGFFISNGQQFKAGHFQTKETAFNGQHSMKLPKSDGLQFGMEYDWTNFEKGKSYVISVWVKKEAPVVDCQLVVSSPSEEQFYLASNELGDGQKRGWKQIRMTVFIPKHFSHDALKVYVYSNGQAAAYFDDLRIAELAVQGPPSIFQAQQLQLELEDKAYRQITRLRNEALKKGLLVTQEDSWVKGKLVDGAEELPVKLRLKGDWLDHLQGQKWSFRIKVKDPNAWNRLKTFSLQTPEARYYALEWLLHCFWEREDVLTTRYDFVQLSLNDQFLGTYAYEEHFEKYLVEYKQRREGPILKFTESALWEVRLRQIKRGHLNNFQRPAIAAMEQSNIQAFQEEKIKDNPALLQQMEAARELMYQYQQGLQPAKAIFDLPKMGRYYAVADIMGANHGYIWHNQRFYYNPVIGKLEPIGYDGFSGRPRRDPLALGKAMIENGPPEDVVAMCRLFDDPDFIEAYMEALYRLTEESYLQQWLDEAWPGLSQRIDFLKAEFPKMKIERQRIIDRAKAMRQRFLPFQRYSIKARWKQGEDGQRTLELSNIHEMPLKVVAWSTAETQVPLLFEQSYPLGPLRIGYPRPKREIELPKEAQFIYYQAFGIDSLFQSPIQPWINRGEKPIAVQQLLAKGPPINRPYCQVKDQVVLFEKGNHVIREWIVIPPGYEVYMEAGLQLDIQAGGGFISQSPVYLKGNGEEPILIQSSDQKGGGFTVLEAEKASGLDYVIFDGLNSLQYQSWNLTGAVCFYESDVRINNCIIRNNVCEDALNIIRSKFKVQNSRIEQTFSDGFDADFCEGELVDSHFEKTGNDGIDFSGSQISVQNCTLRQCGDKGISVGEESKVDIYKVDIDGAVIGIASKDLSYARVRSVRLANCNQGFAAYQKKPEYGQSTIYVQSYSAEEVKYLHTIAPRCTLELQGRVIVGE